MDALLFFIFALVCVFLTLHLDWEERGWGVALIAAAVFFVLVGVILLGTPEPVTHLTNLHP